MYDYNIFQWVIVFFTYCFIGWIFESVYVSVRQKKFVNRGFLRGPLLPIYGTGAVMVLHVVLPVRDFPVFVFVIGMAVATVLEYITSAAMEAIFKMRYWDYSTHKFQYKGRICLSSSIAWGALSVWLTEVLHKPVERMIFALGSNAVIIASVILTIAFAVDFVSSCRTAFNVNKLLQEVTGLKSQAESLRVQLALINAENYDLYEIKQNLQLLYDDAKAEISELKDIINTGDVHELKSRIELATAEAKARLEDKFNKINYIKREFIKGNPTSVSKYFNEALNDIKQKINEVKRK